jgi:hypothetical protein
VNLLENIQNPLRPPFRKVGNPEIPLSLKGEEYRKSPFLRGIQGDFFVGKEPGARSKMIGAWRIFEGFSFLNP